MQKIVLITTDKITKDALSPC